jgi:hypothetical protein
MLNLLIRMLLALLHSALGLSVLLGRLLKDCTDGMLLLSQCDKMSDEPFCIVTKSEL